MGLLEEEMDSLRMPIVDEYKMLILKQRANAYRRTVQGQTDRDVNIDILLPKVTKDMERAKRAELKNEEEDREQSFSIMATRVAKQ